MVEINVFVCSRDSRVVTMSRPYDVGVASVRRHNIPMSSIPCYAYRSSPILNDKSSRNFKLIIRYLKEDFNYKLQLFSVQG